MLHLFVRRMALSPVPVRQDVHPLENFAGSPWAERLALYIIENRATVRAAAAKFGISKSTVHKDISERLPHFNRTLYLQDKEVLDVNKAQRHIRGGIATRKKYRGA